jgi:hypothetical protein
MVVLSPDHAAADKVTRIALDGSPARARAHLRNCSVASVGPTPARRQGSLGPDCLQVKVLGGLKEKLFEGRFYFRGRACASLQPFLHDEDRAG